MSIECPVCLINWCSKTGIPKMLTCGHSYCENCLQLLYQESMSGGLIQCPICMQEHIFNSKEEVGKIATNFSLIQKPRIRHKSVKETQSDLENVENDDFSDENFNVEIEPNAKGAKHNSPIHSYVKSNKILLCSVGIVEGNYAKAKVKSITQVIKETRGGMYSYKLKLNQNLLQLKRFREIIERIKGENQRKVQENIKKHFNKIDQIVKNAEKLAFQKFDVQK